MKPWLIAGALLLALAAPASADQCMTITEVQQMYDTHQTEMTQFEVVSDADTVHSLSDLLATKGHILPDNVTEIVFATFPDGATDYGFEVGGCLSPPIHWPQGLRYPLGGA